jgi:hypothetical protein
MEVLMLSPESSKTELYLRTSAVAIKQKCGVIHEGGRRRRTYERNA